MNSRKHGQPARHFTFKIIIAKLSKAEFSLILTQSAVWAGVHAVWAGVYAVWAGVQTVWAGVHPE